MRIARVEEDWGLLRAQNSRNNKLKSKMKEMNYTGKEFMEGIKKILDF